MNLARKLMIGTVAAPPSGPFPYSFETKNVGTPNGSGDVVYDDTGIKWTVDAEAKVTVSALHVTLGSNSWKIDTASSFFAWGTTEPPAIDLTGYSTISVDVYVESIDGADNVAFEVADETFTDYYGDYTTTGATGSFTLTVDLTVFTQSKTNCYINLVSTFNTGVFYIDNLRVT